MIGSEHLYDDFGIHAEKGNPKGQRFSESEIEDLKLTAFEQGFAAGWDDAIKAQEKSEERLSEETLEALRDAKFSVHEARRGLIDALTPLYVQLCVKLLPVLGKAGLPLHVAEQLKQMTSDSLEQPIELLVPANATERLEDLLELEKEDSIIVSPFEGDSAMAARIRVGAKECDINIQRLVRDIEESLKTAVHSMKQEAVDG